MRIVDVVPASRVHKATRCRHCAFSRPRETTGGLRICAEPGHAGVIVLGDQMACGQYRPATQETVREAA
jgi:hypothetical protein